MRSSALITVLRGFIEPTVMADGALRAKQCRRNRTGRWLDRSRSYQPQRRQRFRANRFFHRGDKRIGRCRLEYRMAQRQVDDVDTELRFVRRREFQLCCRSYSNPSAARVEHLEANEIDGRRDALEDAV